MKKVILGLTFSTAMIALTSCGKIDTDSDKNKINNEFTTTSVTTGTTTGTTTATEIKALKKRSSEKTTFTEADTASPQPLVNLSSDTKSEKVSVRTISNISGSGSSGGSAYGNTSSSNIDNSSKPVKQSNKKEEKKDPTDISNISGKWDFQQIYDYEQFTSCGYFEIQENGRFVFFDDEGNISEEGYLKVEYDEMPDGTKLPFFAFYVDENDEESWDMCYCDHDDPNVYYFGNGGMSRIIREGYTIDDQSFNDIADVWNYQEIDRTSNEYVTLGQVEIGHSGYYTFYPCEGSDSITGIIKIEYETYPDGTSKPFYAFYNNEDTLWTSCFFDQLDHDRFYAGNGGTVCFERSTETIDFFDFDYIADTWEYQENDPSDLHSSEYITKGELTIDYDGYYTYTSMNGSDDRSGKIRKEQSENGEYEFRFYDYGQYFWISCPFQYDWENTIDLNTGNNLRLTRYINDEPSDYSFIGEWGDDDTVVSIEKEGSDYYISVFKTIESTYEYYKCIYDEDKEEFVCSGEGTLNDIKYGENQTNDLIYNNIFRIDGDDLIWNNIKEHKEMRFSPI